MINPSWAILLREIVTSNEFMKPVEITGALPKIIDPAK
jgi:hypothetical protein